MEVKKEKGLNKLLKYILSGSNAVGSLIICVMMLVITYDVCGRTFFNISFVGTPEIVSNSLVAVAFLQIGYVLMEGRHVRATVIYDKVPKKVQYCFDLFAYGVGLILFIALIYSSWPLFLTAVKVGEFEGEGALRVPVSPVRFIILFGSVLMSLQFIKMILGTIKDMVKKSEPVIEKGE